MSRAGVLALLLLLGLGGTPALGQTAGSPTAPAAPARHLSLKDALRTGLSTSPNLRQARVAVEQARLNVDAVGVQMNPTLSAGASYAYQFQPVTTSNQSPLVTFLNRLVPGLIPVQKGNANSVSGSATLQKLVTTFGRVQWETTAARLALQQWRSQYRSTLETEIQNIEVAYMQALLAEGQLDVARQVLADQQALLENSRARVQAGLNAEYDLIQFQSTVHSSEQQVEYAQANVDSAHVALQALVGLPVTEVVTLDPLPDPVPPPRSLQEGLDRALRLRPDLVALDWGVRSADAQVEASARSSYPSVTVQSTYTGSAEFGQDWSPTFVTSVAVQVPILDGGQARVQMDQAKVAVEQARASLEQMRRQVGQDVADAYISLTSTWRQLSQARAALQSSSEALDIARLRFQAGLANAVEVLNVQNTYIAAAGQVTNLRGAYWIAQANWRRAISDSGDVELPEEVRMDPDMPAMPAPDPAWELPPGSDGGPKPPEGGTP